MKNKIDLSSSSYPKAGNSYLSLGEQPKHVVWRMTTSGVIEGRALVLTSYEKTCGDVEETRRWPKGPFATNLAVGMAATGARTAAARETRNTLWRATSVPCLHAR